MEHIYLFPSLFYLLGEEIPTQAEGKNLWDLVEGKTESFRDYVTSALKTWLWARDDTYAMIRRSNGEEVRLYNIKNDPECRQNIAEDEKDTVNRMYELMLADAGGDIPVYPDPRAW